MKQPINVTITGAAGQIGYALAFRVASGAMLGPDQPVNLHLLEITPALPQLQGVVMELMDCAFPTLNDVVATDDGKVAFRDCGAALLVGARPRGPGMERKDLLEANGKIFAPQGRALDAMRKGAQNLAQQLQQQLGKPEFLSQALIVPNADGGFLVRQIQPGSLYEKLGLRPGDVIRNVNGQALTSMEDVMKLYQQFGSAQRVLVEVQRQGRNETLYYDMR